MEHAGLSIFPWDFADEGLDEVLDFVRDLGITRLVLASVYHAGFFIHPHNPKRKVHLLEDGVCYFHPTESRYAESSIKPTVAAMCSDVDWFGLICERAQKVGLKVSAWTVCLHNTRIGLSHPECTIQNVYGDSYPHALTPGHPTVIKYLRAVVADLAEKYPLYSLFLEAPDYRRRKHGGGWVSGHHHERDGVHLRELEEELMDLSFNPADVEGAKSEGVDVEEIRKAVRYHLDRYFDAAPTIPTDLPETFEEFRSEVPALTAFEAYFRHAEEALLAELREEAEPRGVRLEGAGNSPSLDIVLRGAYGEPLDRVAAIAREGKSSLMPHQQLVVGIRLGFYSPGMGIPILSEEDAGEMTRAVSDNGADGIVFYNYSEAPRRSIEWIKPALKSVGFTSLKK